MNDKPPAGYPTPSKQLQDAFTKTQADLSNTKVKWTNVHSTYADILRVTRSDSPDFNVILTVTMLAKLGKEVTEVHERLAKLERTVATLKPQI